MTTNLATHQTHAKTEIENMADSLNDADFVIYWMADYEWGNEDTEDTFGTMVLHELCEEVAKNVRFNYPNQGGSWKRKIENAFNEFAVSFGMRLTKLRMEKGRYG